MIRGHCLYHQISLWDYRPYGTGPNVPESLHGSWTWRRFPNRPVRYRWTPPAPWMNGKKMKKKKKKKHHRSKKSDKPELKVTTWGKGADTPVWTHSRPTKDSSSSSDSQPEGDSGLGSNPPKQPRWGTDTESWWGFYSSI